MTTELPRATDADIVLLLEGTFPYVSGGVSSWVNQMITGLPEYRFGVVFLGSRPEDYGPLKYVFPTNLVHVETHYLFAPAAEHLPERRTPSASAQAARCLHAVHEPLRARMPLPTEFQNLDFYLKRGAGLSLSEFLYGEESWRHITTMYEQRCTDPSFVDYFWTVRNMHLPIWQLAQIAQALIPARVYHTVSTGYAGLLGALLHWHTRRPVILSEHGIYTKERRIDLLNAAWIADQRSRFERDPSEISYLRELWIRFFESLGRLCYDAAYRTVALFPEAQARQITDGADPARSLVIPNGVDIAPLARLRTARDEGRPPVLCLLGRVAPIKDVKTFIRAMHAVVNTLPAAQGWIVGPESEDPEYARECRNLAESLGLTGRVTFTGFQRIAEVLPRVSLLVLSSISEGLPLVILEGFAAGVPAVTTDVGACRRLILGDSPADQALGAAGALVGIADPLALSQAALALLQDSTRWQQARQAAMARVEQYYTETLMFERYRALYAETHGLADTRDPVTARGN